MSIAGRAVLPGSIVLPEKDEAAGSNRNTFKIPIMKISPGQNM